MAPRRLLSMLFSPSTPLPVVVTVDTSPRADQLISLPADRVITISCSEPLASASAEQRITWQELLGQR